MSIESLPLVVFLLLPGFLSWLIFSWGTVSRKMGQIQHIFASLIFSLFAFTLAYYLTYLIKFIGINVFSASWNIALFPKYMQILINPEILPPELWVTLYIIAIILGFLLISLYKNENIARILNRIGLDLYAAEDVWYRLFHHSDFITIYLKDGNIIAGWPTYFSQTGKKESAELYLTKIRYFRENEWVSPHTSVDGVLINTDSISRIEFRKSEVANEPETGENQTMRTKRWQWVEFYARLIVWIGGLLFAVLTVLGVIPILPANTSIQLMIFLYLFLFAALITWWFDMSRMFPPRRR